jgi:hypothetical protein
MHDSPLSANLNAVSTYQEQLIFHFCSSHGQIQCGEICLERISFRFSEVLLTASLDELELFEQQICCMLEAGPPRAEAGSFRVSIFQVRLRRATQ